MTMAIILLSSVPHRSLPGDGSVTDQVITNLTHIPAYALFAVLWLKAFEHIEVANNPRKVIIGILSGLVLFAFADEFHQSFVPGRSASLMDIGLDLAGILLGLTCFRLFFRTGTTL